MICYFCGAVNNTGGLPSDASLLGCGVDTVSLEGIPAYAGMTFEFTLFEAGI